jgi:hypothetical protein
MMSMKPAMFSERQYRILQVQDARVVVCDVPASRVELDALTAALAWRRQRAAHEPVEDADTVLALRALATLDERLRELAAAGAQAPLTLDQADAGSLCEVASAYVSERDFTGFTSREERARIEVLVALAGALMDCCCELTAADEQARANALIA